MVHLRPTETAISFRFAPYVIRVHLAVGHFPQPYSPQSWKMGFELHYALLRPWFVVFPLGWLPLVAAALDLGVWAIARRFPIAAFIALGVSSLLVYGSIVLDPGQLIVWFMD